MIDLTASMDEKIENYSCSVTRCMVRLSFMCSLVDAFERVVAYSDCSEFGHVVLAILGDKFVSNGNLHTQRKGRN